jgi:hypothetical protein
MRKVIERIDALCPGASLCSENLRLCSEIKTFQFGRSLYVRHMPVCEGERS